MLFACCTVIKILNYGGIAYALCAKTKQVSYKIMAAGTRI